MITIEEARIQQKKAEKKSIVKFSIYFLILTAVCTGMYFVGNWEFYISLGLYLIVLFCLAFKVGITEFFHKKEYAGKVYHFEVRTEQIKEKNVNKAGSENFVYTIFVADLYVKDQKGKIRKKTFTYSKDYDNVHARDKAIIFRFVDKPIIQFQNRESNIFGKDKGDRTTDWKFDFSSLPHWENRERIPYVFDKFHPIPQSDTLCCIYSIAEAGMMNYIGFLAILKNKSCPELLLNVSENMNFCDNFSVDKSGNIIFLQPFIYDKISKTIKTPILIIDIRRKKFSYYKTDNYNSLYKVVELSENVFGVKANETQINDERLMELSKQKIDLRILEWFELSEIETLPEKIE